MTMKTEEWQSIIRNLLYPVQYEDAPWERTDLVLPWNASPEAISEFRSKCGQAIQAALNDSRGLGGLTLGAHSEEIVVAYLEALWERIKDAPTKADKPVAKVTPISNEKLLICVDFDGTIVEHRYPAIGPALPHAFDVLKALQGAGHRLVLFTCREDHPEARRGTAGE